MEADMELKELIEKINFSEETLTSAMIEQSALLLDASEYRVKIMRRRFQAEAELRDNQTDVAIRMRRSKEKLTEAAVKELIAADKSVRSAQSKVDELKALEEWAKSLVDAYHSRGSMCKALVQLIGAEAAMESGFIRAEMERMGIRKLKNKVTSHFPGAKL